MRKPKLSRAKKRQKSSGARDYARAAEICPLYVSVSNQPAKYDYDLCHRRGMRMDQIYLRTPASSYLYRYGLVVASCAIGTGLGWATGAKATCLLLAVIFSSLSRERIPSLISVFLCAAAFGSFFLSRPAHAWMLPADFLRLAAFLIAAFLVRYLVRSGRVFDRSYRAAVDTVPIGMIAVDSAGMILSVNPAITEIFGYGSTELKGKPLSLLLPDFALKCAGTEEVKAQRKDGERFAAEVGFGIEGSEDRRRWIGFIRDITLQLKDRDALGRAQRDLGLLMDMIPGMVWRSDLDDKIDFLNQYALDYLGEPIENVQRREQFIHPEDVPARQRAQNKLMSSGMPQAVEVRVRRNDGEYRWFHSRMQAVRDEQQKIVGYCGLMWDCDEQKRANDALTAAMNELNTLMESIPAMVLVKRADGTVEYGNQQMLDFVDMTLPEFRQHGCEFLAHPDEMNELIELYGAAVAEVRMFRHTYRWLRHDGQYVWIENVMNPVVDEAGNILKWYGVVLDATDRVRAEQVLKESEQKYIEIIEGIPARVFRCGPDGKAEYVNSRHLEFTGKTREEVLGFGYIASIHPDDVGWVMDKVGHSLRTGVPFRETYRERRADGEYVWIESSAQPFRGQDGTITKWYGINIVVDELKKATDALAASQAEFRLMLDSSPALICRSDPSGRPISMNKRMAEYTGFGEDDLDKWTLATPPANGILIEPWQRIIHPDDFAAIEPIFQEAARTGRMFGAELRLKRWDGVYRWFHLRGEPLSDSEGRVVSWFGAYLDIHDARKMEEQLTNLQNRLTRASQAAAAAELSASIAHEVNQPLTAIIAHSEACIRWLSSATPDIERAVFSATNVVHEGMNAAEIVRRIRSLFQKAPSTKSLIDLNHLIVEVVRMLAARLRESQVTVCTELAADLPPLMADYVQIQQVLANLIQNAIEAMKDTPAPLRLITLRSVRRDDCAEVEIEDHGHGIEDITMIFETFYSTKTSGFGMGLPICRSIAEAHRGRLWAESKGTCGSIFHFTIPATTNEHDQSPEVHRTCPATNSEAFSSREN